MKPLEKRVLKIEAEIQPVRMSAEQVRLRIDELLAKAGTTRERVMAEHGDLRGYCRWLVSNRNKKQVMAT